MRLKEVSSSASELKTAEYLLRQGWRFIAHDLRIARVQVDLLMRDPRGILTIVEVKSQSHMAHLSQSQFRRLSRVALYLSGYEPVQMHLVMIGNGEFRVLPVDALTV